jgi:hypothetical protein
MALTEFAWTTGALDQNGMAIFHNGIIEREINFSLDHNSLIFKGFFNASCWHD